MKPSQNEQGMEAWRFDRLGIPTASQYGALLARGRNGSKSSTRENYKMTLALERLTQKPTDTISTPAMERGTEFEPVARFAYELHTGNKVEESGFRRHEILNTGASPDGLVQVDNWKGEGAGGIEIKNRTPAHHLEAMRSGKIPAIYIPQVQGNLMNHPEANWWDWISYNADFPANAKLVIVRAYRDEDYIAKLEAEIQLFNDEVDAIVAETEQFEN